MSARSDLAKLLAQWLELTRAEGGAIQAAAWARVSEIQSHKAALQKSFDETREKWAGEYSGRVPAAAKADPFRAELGRLLSLEERNRALLAAQLQRVQTEQGSLDQAYQNLRKIQRSYTRKPYPTAWQCFS